MDRVFMKMVFAFCFGVMATRSHAQQTEKKKMTAADFELWSTLRQVGISPDGKWITYGLKYDNQPDTLFLKHTVKTEQYAYPLGSGHSFSKDGKWFVVKDPKEGVVLRNLRTGTVRMLGKATQVQFIGDEKFLLLRQQEEEVEGFSIVDLESEKQHLVEGVLECAVSTDKKSIGFITVTNSVEIITPAVSFKSRVLAVNNELLPYKNLVWGKDDTAVAFCQELPKDATGDANHRIFYFTGMGKKEQLFCLDPKDGKGPLQDERIVLMPAVTALTIAPDNQRVFFTVAGPRRKVTDENSVEIWNAAEPLEIGRRQIIGNPSSHPKLLAWWPQDDRILRISSDKELSVSLTADRKYALVYDPYRYEPQQEINSPSDFYMVDIEKGERRMILQQQSRKVGTMGAAPNGRYLHYYKNEDWWVYDMVGQRHINLTVGLGNFEEAGYDRGALPPPYGCPGWTSDGSRILVYDQYDIWLLSPQGDKPERITRGKEKGIRYRIYEDSFSDYRTFQMIDFIGNDFDLSQGLILEALGDDKSSGYYSWTRKKGVAAIVYGASGWSRFKKALLADGCIAVNQDTGLSPQIIGFDSKAAKGKVLVRTNGQQEKYYWGTAEKISYSNSRGTKLEGILLYPANYQSSRKYPMVVSIYERQSEALHQYHRPTLYNPAGFNPANYTSDDYFVLLPDIAYLLGEPGSSAVDCVDAAVREVITKGIVDEKHIGLIGHSFGGYEASVIAGRSTLFAAIVAGAAVTDLVGHSLSLDVSGRSQMWRYQTHQMRMGAMLYDDYKRFIDNSPIAHASAINVPLLSWNGADDNMVEARQGIQLHNAMRHLKKRHVLLRYPGQDHVLFNPKFQKDLTLRIKAWFDHYLKGIAFPEGYSM